MHARSPLFSYEYLIYPAILVLNSLAKGYSILGTGDSTVLMGGALSIALNLALLVFVYLRKPLAFIITAVYLFLSGALSLFAGFIALTGDTPPYVALLLAVFAFAYLFGGYRMLRMWQGLRAG